MTNLYSLSSCPAWLEDAIKVNTVRPLVFLVGTKMDLLVYSILLYHFLLNNFLVNSRLENQSATARQHVEAQATRMARALQAEYWVILCWHHLKYNKSKLNYKVSFSLYQECIFQDGRERRRHVYKSGCSSFQRFHCHRIPREEQNQRNRQRFHQ